MCARMHVKFVLQPIDWNAKILDLNSKNIDVIWNRLTITPDCLEKIDFSKPYIANRQIIIVQASSIIDRKTALAGKTIGFQLGSSAEGAINADQVTAQSFAPSYKHEDNIQTLMGLGAEKINAVVVDEILSRYYISKKPGKYSVVLWL